MADRTGDEPTGSIGSASTIIQAAPVADRLAMELARARSERALFGTAEPARLNRYELQQALGDGGMGVVYGAYDPELDRKVALKIVHPGRNHDARARQRLALEARALAKLDHPNVVKVYDVIVHDGQIVIVMEWLEGETLADWQKREPRSWQDIIAVYAEAGAGLAAAHGVPVVHRDFKPTNVIISGDGRVRVLDFGLAQLTRDDGDPRAVEASGALSIELTATGDVVGTVAYAAPEQLEAGAVTAASDQFSFCVALHRAIEGVAPFEGSTLAERIANIRAGEIRYAAAPRRVPAWLRAAIARGLAADPRVRYPAMTDVLDQLRRLRGWRRWRTPTLMGVLAVLCVTATATLHGPGPDTSCDGGARQISAVWNSQLRDQVDNVIGKLGTPYTQDVRTKVVATLDQYATSWSATHRESCRSHRRGAVSPLLFDRQMTCLAERLGDLSAATEILLHSDPASATMLMDVAARIPQAARCADLPRLQAEAPPPDTLAQRLQVEMIRSQISTAEALSRGGRSEQALELAMTASARAAGVHYQPIEIEAGLAEGRIRLATDDTDGAIRVLEPVRSAALQRGMPAAAIEAAARVIFARGRTNADIARLEDQLIYVLPISRSLSGDSFAGPLLLNNIGVYYKAAGRKDDALRYFREAKDLLRGGEPSDFELMCIDRNLAMETTDAPIREALFKQTWQRLRDALGQRHPATLDAQFAYALYAMNPALAFEEMSKLADSYRRFHPTFRRQLANIAVRRARLAAELGDPARTAAAYDLAVEATAEAIDDDVVQWHHLSVGERALLRHDPALAVAELTVVHDARATSPNWWERADALRAIVGRGRAQAARGELAAATHDLEDAVRDYPAILAITQEVEHRRYFARAQRALAAVLRRGNREQIRIEQTRIDALEQASRAFYRAAGSVPYRWLLEATGDAE